MNRWIVAILISTAATSAGAADLCSINPYTLTEAQQGRAAFDSHCALCHQYSMRGRVPGNFANESPNINLLSEGDLKFLDNAGGNVPPLLGRKFFEKERHDSLLEFTNKVGGAANTFPTKDFKAPASYMQIAAYVLYRNCGRL
ncbi:MAG TPA: hypothetical protein VMF03_15445 [Steroidobacteraceae bacterium]|nr:hypothetical protein [Steroidobacteraceae bacterium]